MAITGHHSTIGHVKRLNQSIKQFIRYFLRAFPWEGWLDWLYLIKFIYTNSKKLLNRTITFPCLQWISSQIFHHCPLLFLVLLEKFTTYQIFMLMYKKSNMFYRLLKNYINNMQTDIDPCLLLSKLGI